MKKTLYTLGFLALALTVFAAEPVAAGHAEVRLAPLGRSMSPPRLGRKEGWLTISNRDWQDYTVRVEKERVIVTPGGGYGRYGYNGGYGEVTVPSGSTVTMAVEKDTYKVYGTNGDKVNAKVREGRTTTISLEPFGHVGQTGLQAIVNDGERVRNEVIIDAYQAPVIIERPPTVIVERPRPVPPPPPVIINRPPVIIGGGRPGNHRPGPPRVRPTTGAQTIKTTDGALRSVLATGNRLRRGEDIGYCFFERNENETDLPCAGVFHPCCRVGGGGGRYGAEPPVLRQGRRMGQLQIA